MKKIVKPFGSYLLNSTANPAHLGVKIVWTNHNTLPTAEILSGK